MTGMNRDIINFSMGREEGPTLQIWHFTEVFVLKWHLKKDNLLMTRYT